MAGDVRFDFRQLKPLIDRFGKWSRLYRAFVDRMLDRGLFIMWQSVPGYPRPRPRQKYVRTGTLGRSLGVTDAGSPLSMPDIFKKQQIGGKGRAIFGTRLNYAKHVIGRVGYDQLDVFKGRWWTLPETVLNIAKPKILNTWKKGFIALARGMVAAANAGKF